VKHVVILNNRDYFAQPWFQAWLWDAFRDFCEKTSPVGIDAASLLTFIRVNFGKPYFRLMLVLEDKEPIGLLTMELAGPPYWSTVSVSLLYMKEGSGTPGIAKELKGHVLAFQKEQSASFLTFMAINMEAGPQFARMLGINPAGEYYAGTGQDQQDDKENG
jgi:hypothetical protein